MVTNIRNRRGRLVALAAMATACLSGCGEFQNDPVEVGFPAPAYSSVNLAGESVDLGDLEGKVVLLNVWATWCAPCREEIPALQALYEENASRGLEVVGVSVDGRGEEQNIRRFAEEFAMTYPIWHDPEDLFGLTFKTIGVPVTFLLDREGVIRWRHMGPVLMNDPGLMAALNDALNET